MYTRVAQKHLSGKSLAFVVVNECMHCILAIESRYIFINVNSYHEDIDI